MISQVFKFALVGLSATFVHALIFSVSAQTIHPQAANFIGYLAAVTFSYALHSKITFRSENQNGLKQLTRFVGASIMGFLLNAVWVCITVNVFRVNVAFANIGIIFFTPAITFLLMKYWVFPYRRSTVKF